MRAALVIASHLLFQLVCTSRPPDCISHMDACVPPYVCRNEQTVLTNICHLKDGDCRMTDAKLCNGSLQMMFARSPALRECVCSGTNPCNTIQQLYSHCQHYLAQNKKQLEAEWQVSDHKRHVHQTNRSCLEEIAACLGDEACNRRMVPFVQECNAFQCNTSQCRQAVRQFYSALPHSVAETLVFCDCDTEDQDCLQMKASLHSGSCVNDQSQTPWTCLEALDSCSENAMCRQIFNRYLSKCFEAEESAFDSGAWLHLDSKSLGETLECRVAFVETMGSVLHHPCTCDGLHHQDQNKCNEMKRIFQDKLSRTKENFRLGESHESKIVQHSSNELSTKQRFNGENAQHGQSEDSSYGQQPTNESSINQKWLSDQLLYLLLYISALMVVVVLCIAGLVLLKLRRIHQAADKPTFEAHQSKSRMLSSVII